MAFDLSSLFNAMSNVGDIPSSNGGQGMFAGLSSVLRGPMIQANGGQQPPSFAFANALANQNQQQPVTATDTSQPTQVQGLTVNATPTQPKPQMSQADMVKNIVNANSNVPEDQAFRQIQGSYAPHTGLFGMHGMVRNIVGTLGDSILMSHGQAPVYRPQVQREQLADAMAGYATDPQHAIARVAALDVPGAAETAIQMQAALATQDLHKAQLESNNQYRQARMETLQDARDARVRQGVGGILGAAIQGAGGDPSKVDPQVWASAVAQARKLGSKASDWDDSEAPDDPRQYVAGYGQTANQVSTAGIRQNSIDQRHQDALARLQEAIRWHNMYGGGNMKLPTDASIAAPILKKLEADPNYVPTAGELDVLNRTGHPANRGQRSSGITLAPPSNPNAQPQQGNKLPPKAPPANGPSPNDIAWLKANRNNPKTVANFKAHFGDPSQYLK